MRSKLFIAISYREIKDTTLPPLINSLNGMMAGCVSGFIVTPFDVSKTRLMTYDFTKDVPSTWQILLQIY